MHAICMGCIGGRHWLWSHEALLRAQQASDKSHLQPLSAVTVLGRTRVMSSPCLLPVCGMCTLSMQALQHPTPTAAPCALLRPHCRMRISPYKSCPRRPPPGTLNPDPVVWHSTSLPILLSVLLLVLCKITLPSKHSPTPSIKPETSSPPPRSPPLPCAEQAPRQPLPVPRQSAGRLHRPVRTLEGVRCQHHRRL